MPTSPRPPRPDAPQTVVIASALQPELVERIRAVDPNRLRIVHEPDLLPTGAYAGGYMGSKPSLSDADKARWHAILAEADILFEFDWLEPERLRENAPHLRWLQASKSGIGEFVRRLGLDRSGITLCTAAGVHAVPLAEWVVFGLLWLAKDLWRVLDQQERHHWEQFEAGLLRGRRVLVVGLGGVGREIARLLAAHGVEVWGVRRSGGVIADHVARVIPFEGFEATLGDVDAVVLACPYTAETHHLLDARRLALLRRGAHVVNVARGAVIGEAALVEALRSGQVGGAVLDVQEREPLPADAALWDAPHVLISPHRASIVPVENELIVDLFVDNLRRDLAGLPLRNVYDPDREY
jgi:phosphoglycerate dehydrogenase-like enzyme